MATTVVERSSETRSDRSLGPVSAHGPVLVTALTFLVLIVHGYHPWSEDGGLYAAGIKRLLNPRLYPHQTEFVTGHLRFSLFAPAVAALTRASRLPLDWILLLAYCATTWLTLYAAWKFSERLFLSLTARCGGVTLLACWLSLPLAGTSLMLMDPYVTARSISTPLGSLALCWTLDALANPSTKAWLLCTSALLFAAAAHPLMAGYALGSVLLIATLGSRLRLWGSLAIAATSLLLALAIQLHAAPESADYIRIAMTRYYWFPGRWQWYERIGLIAPLLILTALLLWKNRASSGAAYATTLRMTIALGTLSMGIAALFSRARLTTHAVARLQPLRTIQTIYIVMILVLGATLAEYLLKKSTWRWATLIAVASAPMYVAQRAIAPASLHLELPWRTPQNPWVQAFLWIRGNTPTDAFFAMEPHYITTDGEDAQSFRAIAERSTLPDYSKDGGEASITPQLTAAWATGQSLQASIEHQSDAARLSTLAPVGVDWIILRTTSQTAFNCPYHNAVVKVCRLR